ncbi:acyl-CoA dehydrogenase family protein [Actinomadura algeriensis]|uniref:Alkylation response protein AidB-like acyl-CoA dehydrogenase n=1 Tax=Actinomadura algeriensis TaxID=1679523 RepID=A0ABR9JSV5_9ACTN|nr:acyl-CoA dehydrogenase family protein [Actinomadura algeriensis]MBE1533578.1 alkylation response protein AidB-like acyl-CoA dehydrogenase [Actinomadura algeriensis]
MSQPIRTEEHAAEHVDERTARRVAEEARESEWRLPSFGKQLFLGDFRLDLVHPHPRPDDADRAKGDAFLAKLTEFCTNEVDAARIEREARIPDETLRGLRDLGAFGMKVPERYGGLGLGQFHYGRALMIAGSASPAIGALLSAHQSIGVPQPVKMFGSDEQKDAWLPRCATQISAFLLTEPDVGSDPARLRATATPDGDGYVLNGVKLWTTNGVVADLVVVMARVPKSDGRRGGISAFIVDMDTPGITVENRNAFMGLRGIENGVTRFHDVRVPKENMIGKEGAGLKIALATLNTGRLSLPALCAASGKWAAKIAREWSAERVQWGRPVGRHEAVARKVAFIAATAYAMEAVHDLSARLADEARGDIRIEAALAKLWSSELACRVADELVQVRGGRGYETAESLAARGERGVPAEQMLRDLRINRIFEGSSEIMHLLIAREAVDAHLAVAGDIIDPDTSAAGKARAAARAGGFYARWLPTLVTGPGRRPGSYAEFGPLAKHLRYTERASRKLARSIFYAAGRWQGGLEQKQGFLGRMVDIGAELYAMSAVCVRAHADASGKGPLQDGGKGPGKSALLLADAFCKQSRVRVEELFDGLWRNTDAMDVRLARAVLDGAFTWVEEGVLDPSIPGPWIAPSEPGPSGVETVHRHVI